MGLNDRDYMRSGRRQDKSTGLSWKDRFRFLIWRIKKRLSRKP